MSPRPSRFHPAPDLERCVPRLVRMLFPRRRATAGVAYASNQLLRTFKRRFLKKTVPFVDVLAFPAGDFPPHAAGLEWLGDIYINESFRGNPDQTIFYLAHGLVHLLGYQHRGKNDTMVMQRLERRCAAHLRSVKGQIVFRSVPPRTRVTPIHERKIHSRT